jgi:polyisoprenoid-binding protein YceI
MIGRESRINSRREHVHEDISHVPPGTWSIDPADSQISFGVRHLGIHEVKGNLRSFSGTIITEEDVGRSSATASVDLSSLDTGSSFRDKHLKSNGLLYNESQRDASYESLAVHSTHDAHVVVEGSLSLFSRSRPLTFAVHVDVVSADSLVLTARTEFSRRELGLALHVKPSFFDRAVSDEVAVFMRIVARRVPTGTSGPGQLR